MLIDKGVDKGIRDENSKRASDLGKHSFQESTKMKFHFLFFFSRGPRFDQNACG